MSARRWRLLRIGTALLLLILFAGAAHIKDRWLTPLLLVLPLYLCLKVEAAGLGNALQLKRFAPIYQMLRGRK